MWPVLVPSSHVRGSDGRGCCRNGDTLYTGKRNPKNRGKSTLAYGFFLPAGTNLKICIECVECQRKSIKSRREGRREGVTEGRKGGSAALIIIT